MTDAIDLIAKADKLVWAWCRGSQSGLERAMDEWLEARRSAREAGYVEVLLSRESIEALERRVVLAREASEAMAADGGAAQRRYDEHSSYTLALLDRDLSGELKRK